MLTTLGIGTWCFVSGSITGNMLFVVKGLRRWFHMRSRLVNSLQVLNIQRASEHYLSKIKHSVKYTVDPKQIKLLSIQRHVAVASGLRLADYSWPTRFFCFKWMQMKLTHSINQANYVYCTFSHELQNRMDVFRVELYIYIFILEFICLVLLCFCGKCGTARF